MSIANPQFSAVAEKHGVSIDDVQTLSKQQRRDKLVEILARQDVPFPILPELGEHYLKNFDAGLPFDVGTLSEVSVDLGEYALSLIHI